MNKNLIGLKVRHSFDYGIFTVIEDLGGVEVLVRVDAEPKWNLRPKRTFTLTPDFRRYRVTDLFLA